MLKIKIKTLFNIEVEKPSGVIFAPYIPVTMPSKINEFQSIGRTLRNRYSVQTININIFTIKEKISKLLN
jgi:hypothetical protein